MKTKTKLKNQKPIDIDAHFRYICPDKNCGFDHWLSLKEAQTKNFKIVCDCGKVFKPKRIKSLTIDYAQPIRKIVEQQPTKTTVKQIPIDLEKNCVKLLVGYGFTQEESANLVRLAFNKNPVASGSLLVKYILQNLGELNNECC